MSVNHDARVVATVIGTAIVIGMYKLFFKNFVVYKSVRVQKHAHVFLRSLCFVVAKIYKKAVLSQGNRAMLQVFFSVEVRQQHSLQV